MKVKGKNKQVSDKSKRPSKPSNKPSIEKVINLVEVEALRDRAELIADQKNVHVPESYEILDYEETHEVIHELQVHQIELKIQNEELHRTQLALIKEKEQYFNLYNFAPVGYCKLSEKGLIIEANLTAASLLERPQRELLQQPITNFIYPEDQDIYYLSHKRLVDTQEQQNCELRLLTKHNTKLWIYIVSSINDVNKDNNETLLVLTDISDRKVYEDELNRIAKYDALTNLPNRTLLTDRLYQAMAMSLRHKQPLAVLYIDLDGFKEINDNHGHDFGDQVLIQVANRMKKSIRLEDTISRFGGDEFVGILLDLKSSEYAIPKISELQKIINQPIKIADLTVQIDASIGVSFFPDTFKS